MKKLISLVLSIMMILSICSIAPISAKADGLDHHEGDTVEVTYSVVSEKKLGGMNFEIDYDGYVFNLEKVSGYDRSKYSLMKNDNKLGKVKIDIIITEYDGEEDADNELSITLSFKAFTDFDSSLMEFGLKTNKVIDYVANNISSEEYTDNMTTKLYCQYSNGEDSDTETEPDSDTDIETETEPDSDTDVETGTEPDSDTDVETETEPDSDTDVETGTEPDSDTDVETGTEPDSDTDVETGTEPDSDTDVETGTEPDSDTDVETETEPDPDDSSYPMGDVNNDGIVDALDSVLILRYSINLDDLTEEALAAADVNGDGVIDSADAVAILRYSIGYLDPGINITI